MTDKVKVGIIGMGTIGCVHAGAFKAVESAEITAVCDNNKTRLAKEADRFGVKQQFTDYRDLLKSDVQAVVVGVGNKLHCEVAVAALKAGKHVLLEKPMAMNAVEGEKIAVAAEETGKVLQVGMVRRQDPSAQVVRDYVKRGEFGEIYHIRAVLIRQRGIPGLGSWFTTRADSGGGPIIDIGVHWFDLAMWTSGCWNLTSVSAKTYAKFGQRMADYVYVGMWAGPPKLDGVFDVEDYATGIARFGDKATMSFEISWAANSPESGYVEILGDKGGARFMDGKPLQIITEQQGRPVTVTPQFRTDSKGFEAQARAFLAACRGEAPPAATAREGVTVMRLIDGIYKSSELNKEVAV